MGRLRAMEVNIMAILGLLLLLSAVGLTVDVVWQNTASISVDALGQTISLSPGWLFVAGVGTGAIGLLGVSMLVAGMARARRRRAALVESRSSLESLQAERDRLAVELERERARVSDEEGAVIDLDDERRAEPTPADYAAVPSAAGREPAVDRRHEPVESGRHGLFSRRH
jgi:hypothetical protein